MLVRQFQIRKQPELVGGWATPLKNMSSSIGMMKSPIYGKKCSKPPTSEHTWTLPSSPGKSVPTAPLPSCHHLAKSIGRGALQELQSSISLNLQVCVIQNIGQTWPEVEFLQSWNQLEWWILIANSLISRNDSILFPIKHYKTHRINI